MEALDARVDEVLGNTTAPATKYVYIREISRFVLWLYEHSDQQLDDVLVDGEIRQQLVLEHLHRVPLVSPIYFEILTTQDCMGYIK